MATNILVGVGGGIAAYKSAVLCSGLVKRGYDVQVLMTEHATEFITPLTFQALTKRPVVISTFREPDAAEIAHIAMADRAALYIIAPATANLIAKLATGIADDMVTTTALACTAPLLIAPAMNVHMYDHPTVQQNLATLRMRGVLIADPAEGLLACGYTGKGRLPEPEDLIAIVEAKLQQVKDFAGVRMVVTAGPTVEDIDPVRFLSNGSSGKMGYAIAAAAAQRGAEVTLVSGPTHLSQPVGVHTVSVRSTDDMLQAVLQHVATADVLISAAAPVDFRPTERLAHKWKKTAGMPELHLSATPDILTEVMQKKQPGQTVVGFAAETKDAVSYAREKMTRKGLDLIVVNNLLQAGAGFAVDTNQVTILTSDGGELALPLMSKAEVANRLLDELVERVASHKTSGDEG
jgi:phosphopantothenoylcysteine decarboxylase / phosphopantothenate---cysteine ligase